MAALTATEICLGLHKLVFFLLPVRSLLLLVTLCRCRLLRVSVRRIFDRHMEDLSASLSVSPSRAGSEGRASADIFGLAAVCDVRAANSLPSSHLVMRWPLVAIFFRSPCISKRTNERTCTV